MERSKKSQSSMLLVGCIGLLLLSYIGGMAIKAYRNSRVKPLQIPTQNTPQDKTQVNNISPDNSAAGGSYNEIANPNMMPMQNNMNNDYAFNSNFGTGGRGMIGGMDGGMGGGRTGRGGRGGGMGGGMDGGMGGGRTRGGRGGGMMGGDMGGMGMGMGGGMMGGDMMGGGDTVGGNFNIVGDNTGGNFNVIGDNGGADAGSNPVDQPAVDQSFDDMGGGFN